MANKVVIKLDTAKYQSPTQSDINAAKQFILQREEYARGLVAKIDDSLANAAQEIVTICYKYNVDPKDFVISSEYNAQMMNEISTVMDDLESEIMDYILEYSTRVTTDKEHTNALAAWIALLGRGNRNLQDTLDGYLYKTLKDWEAAIAALRHANVSMADAVTKLKSHLHTIYTMPEVLAAFKNPEEFRATYLHSRGVMQGGVGLSNNGSTNVTNMARTTLQMAWMRSQVMDYKEQGAIGLYVLRGSSYPCTLCDDNCGFHPIEESYGVLPVHPSCCCYAIPIFTKE